METIDRTQVPGSDLIGSGQIIRQADMSTANVPRLDRVIASLPAFVLDYNPDTVAVVCDELI